MTMEQAGSSGGGKEEDTVSLVSETDTGRILEKLENDGSLIPTTLTAQSEALYQEYLADSGVPDDPHYELSMSLLELRGWIFKSVGRGGAQVIKETDQRLNETASLVEILHGESAIDPFEDPETNAA